MSILDANGSIACAKCGEDARAERDQLKAENAELRELLCELYEDQCDECDRWKYRDRMHELGIEVPE